MVRMCEIGYGVFGRCCGADCACQDPKHYHLGLPNIMGSLAANIVGDRCDPLPEN